MSDATFRAEVLETNNLIASITGVPVRCVRPPEGVSDQARQALLGMVPLARGGQPRGVRHLDGRPLAVVYNFACHPIMNPPSKGNSADYPGYASQVIETALGDGTTALFVQGCGGDVNPVRYKEVNLAICLDDLWPVAASA